MIIQRLKKHPCTLEMLSDLFPSYKRGYRRMAMLCKRGKTHVVGHVNEDGTRRKNVYATSSRQLKNPHHEVELSKFCLLYDNGKLERNHSLPHRADARLGHMFIEQDCGTENYSQIRFRMAHYKKLNDNEVVLFVCPTEERLEGILKQGAEVIPEAILCTTLERSAKDPWGMILTDSEGNLARMPRGTL